MGWLTMPHRQQPPPSPQLAPSLGRQGTMVPPTAPLPFGSLARVQQLTRALLLPRKPRPHLAQLTRTPGLHISMSKCPLTSATVWRHPEKTGKSSGGTTFPCSGRRTGWEAAERVGGGIHWERKSSLRSGETGMERNEAGVKENEIKPFAAT